MSDPKPLRESLRRKRSARLAAVQAIYSYEISSPKPSAEKLAKQLKDQWRQSIGGKDDEWPSDDLPENALLDDVITGVISHVATIDEQAETIIKDNWRSERMDPVMVAILRCAIYELHHKPDRKAAVILDEYVSIAQGFFDEPDLGFVHSALQQLLPALR